MKPFEGDSVHYWASPVEAKLCAGEQIALVGAGNSAGQAAVFLAPQVKRLTMVVRAEGLESSMSRYLIDRIRMLENVEVLVHSELAELHGEPMGHLRGATVRNRRTQGTSHLPVRHVFMFIGAEPNTAWLNGCLALDEKGYILTGPRTETTRLDRRPCRSKRACHAYSPSAMSAPALRSESLRPWERGRL